MLSKEDNELICRVGPGTPMGTALRRFWLPAVLSTELPEADGDPVHVELLGQNFVAFRDTNGNVGLLDEHCCHRSASLTVGRVENCGIRCIYHGWLFGVDGTVLETPNVADPLFKTRFKAKSYPVREAGGLVWAYLGDPALQPPLPDFPFNNAPENMRVSEIAIHSSNYVQVMEGLLDSSHLSILHSSTLQKITQSADSDTQYAKSTGIMKDVTSPHMESERTAFGSHYIAVRPTNGMDQTRITPYIAPFWVVLANGDLAMGFFPMNDEKTIVFHVWFDGKSEFGVEPLKSTQLRLTGLDPETLVAYGQTRTTHTGPNRMHRGNGWRQDRVALRNGHFTGMPPITQEDALVTTSSGAIRDRSTERLCAADIAIVHLYRILLDLARASEAGREIPYVGQSIADVNGVNVALPPGTDWRTLVPHHYARPAKVA